MGYQNCCVSSSDLVAGTIFLKKLDPSGSIFLSANVLGKDGKKVFSSGRIYEIKGNKIAVIGITDRPPLKLPGVSSIEDPISSMKKIAPTLAEKADIVILLTSMNLSRTKKLLRACPDIDLVISSGLGVPTYVPMKAGKTLIVSSHPKGKSIGMLRLFLKKGEIKGYDNKLIMLRESANEAGF